MNTNFIETRMCALIFTFVLMFYVAFSASVVSAEYEGTLSFLQLTDASSCRPGVEKRVEGLERLVEHGRLLRDGQEEPMLREVNLFFYRHIQLVTDSRIWGRSDYWATPAELLCASGGDTEDFAIAKYFALSEMGVPEDRLRLAYAESGWFGPVIVLLYYATDGSARVLFYREIWRLEEVMERNLLQPVYAFNEHTLWKVSNTWRFTPVQGAESIQLWQGILRKTRSEPG